MKFVGKNGIFDDREFFIAHRLHLLFIEFESSMILAMVWGKGGSSNE